MKLKTISHSPMIGRVATVREIYLEKIREKSGNLLMAREIKKGLGKSGKSQEIYNKWLLQAENLIILFKRVKGCNFYLPPHSGLCLKERIFSLGKQILSF